jgi:hypothetical protein
MDHGFYTAQQLVKIQRENVPLDKRDPILLSRQRQVALFALAGVVAGEGIHADDLAAIRQQPID